MGDEHRARGYTQVDPAEHGGLAVRPPDDRGTLATMSLAQESQPAESDFKIPRNR